MSVEGWKDHVEALSSKLLQVSFRNSAGDLDAEEGFGRWKELTLTLRENSGTIYLVGNGASASMASHLAADLAKNAHLHTQVFSDLSLITAVSNDMGYENVFSEPLKRRARAGDMLVAISSSGASPNVLSAVDVAKDAEMTVVTLSAMDPENPLRSSGMLNVYVEAETYGYAESAHAVILHHWMDLVEIGN